MTKIVTQEGAPVDEMPEETSEHYEGADVFEEAAKEITKGVQGLRKFRNSIIIKVGLVAVALKAIDVAGKIILENQRLRAKTQDDEKA